VFRGAFRRHGWGEGWGANGIRGTEGAEAETLKASREWGFPPPQPTWGSGKRREFPAGSGHVLAPSE